MARKNILVIYRITHMYDNFHIQGEYKAITIDDFTLQEFLRYYEGEKNNNSPGATEMTRHFWGFITKKTECR